MRIYKSMKLLYHLISNKLPNLSVHQTKMKLTSFNFNLWNHLAESLYINSFLHIQDPYLVFSPNKCNLIHLTHLNGCEKAILQISLKQHTTFTFFTGLNTNPLFFSLHTSFHAILPFLVYIKTKKSLDQDPTKNDVEQMFIYIIKLCRNLIYGKMFSLMGNSVFPGCLHQIYCS